MNRLTTLTMARGGAAPLVDMSGGEVFVEIAARDAGFCVATPHGRAVDLGTRFGVGADRDRTVIVVTEGLVTASTDAG
jgi:ferric-dicitrate binding protein FerR (iron transport regulator)